MPTRDGKNSSFIEYNNLLSPLVCARVLPTVFTSDWFRFVVFGVWIDEFEYTSVSSSE